MVITCTTLIETNCSTCIIKWNKSFLTDRELTVVYHQATADTATFLENKINNNIWKTIYIELYILRAKGIRSKALKFLYQTTILLVYTEESPSWADASAKKLQRQQNRALK